MATPRTVAFHTLGCKLNFSETSSIRRQFEDAGYGVCAFDTEADIYVINTCSVTDFADRKCRYTVRQALRTNPQARIIVMGCYAQLKPREISGIEGVDLVLGAAEKFRILDYIDSLSSSCGMAEVHVSDVQMANTFENAFSFGDRTRTFLKVQDGCDYKCAFCTIPNARGNSRSNTVENVLAQARKLSEGGVKEIVLTGVNIGDFGKHPYTTARGTVKYKRREFFIDLIRALEEVEGIERFRISSIEPNLCTEEVIDFVADSKKFMPHFHLPLQSGSDSILKKMQRRYRTGLYTQRISSIKTRIPHCSIGVDVIVGFPGETHEEFMKTFHFLQGLEVSYLHVFTYSEREHTPAYKMDGVVPLEERKRRNQTLRALSSSKKSAFIAAHLGESRPVLFERSKEDKRVNGFTDNYIKISVPGSEKMINTLQVVELSNEIIAG